jgi:hypothetical protein
MAPLSRSPSDAGTVNRLIREIGITETQAWELVTLLGPNWNSLVREAKELLRQKPGTA